MTASRSTSASIEISLREEKMGGTPGIEDAAGVACAASWSVVFSGGGLI